MHDEPDPRHFLLVHFTQPALLVSVQLVILHKFLNIPSERFVQSTTNDEAISEYREKFLDHKRDILELISHQTLLLSSSHKGEIKKVQDGVNRIEKSIQPLCDYFARLSISKEVQAKRFVQQHGGEEALQEVCHCFVKCNPHANLSTE